MIVLHNRYYTNYNDVEIKYVGIKLNNNKYTPSKCRELRKLKGVGPIRKVKSLKLSKFTPLVRAKQWQKDTKSQLNTETKDSLDSIQNIALTTKQKLRNSIETSKHLINSTLLKYL